MPTTKIKNLFYRFALPFLSPAIPAEPFAARNGRFLSHPEDLVSIIRRNHISGAAILLQSGTDYSTLYTHAVHTDAVPDDHTFYRVASITKMATALLSVRLMDQGFFSPETPLAALLPEADSIPELKGIRLVHLLTHTSGLMDPPDLETMLNRKLPYMKAVSGCRIHMPGEVFRYSNLGFGLIGCALEYRLNKPLEQIYQEFLFHPLGMNATLAASSVPDEQIMPVIRMLPYRSGSGLRVTELGKEKLETADPFIHYGYTAGSMYTDLKSLLKMVRCIRDGGAPLLSPRYSGYMQKEKSRYGSLSPTLAYGTGLLIIRDSRISESPIYGHQGFAYGCVDGAFWEEATGNILISLNGGCSEARLGRFGKANFDLCCWAFRKEFPEWK